VPEATRAAAPDPVAFHPNRVKLRMLSWLVAALAALLIWYAASGAPSPLAVLPVVLVLLAGAVTAGRLASDPRPVLIVDAEGLEDRVHGRVPWRDVAFYRAQGGLAPGFGWGLKKGAKPPRNASLYRVQAIFNALSGLPPRSYRRKLLIAPPQEMAAACRLFRPELERGA
jgi:hypothetical protein